METLSMDMNWHTVYAVERLRRQHACMFHVLSVEAIRALERGDTRAFYHMVGALPPQFDLAYWQLADARNESLCRKEEE